jgi:cytochrome c
MKAPRMFRAAPLASACLLGAGLLTACDSGPKPPPGVSGDPALGKLALTQYACQSCHKIPGVIGSDTFVGRPLEGIGKRPFIAGDLLNNQPNLMRWIQDPQSVQPNTAMPNLGVSEKDARNISAYLLTLD